MVKTDDFIASKLMWKARQNKLPTNTSFFYNDLSPAIQQYINVHIDEATCGQPVLFFTKPTKEWTLVCTRQVICNNNKQVFKININGIDRLQPNVLDNASKVHLIDVKVSKKAEWHQVTVVDKQNNSYILHASNGSDLFALWNILLMAVRLSS